MIIKPKIREYWNEHYNVKDSRGIGGFCSICANTGIIVGRKLPIPNGDILVTKDNYCICPNGMSMRNKKRMGW